MGTHRLTQLSKGVAPLVGGLDIVLQMNQDLLTSLTKVSASGIWKRTQLQHALAQLDLKMGLGLAATQ